MKSSWLPKGLKRSVRCGSIARPIITEYRPRQQVLMIHNAKNFSSSSKAPAIAASEIKFQQAEPGTSEESAEEPKRIIARVVPESPSYFTAQPYFTDSLLSLQRLESKYTGIPTVKPGQAPRVAWRNIVEYRTMVGEAVKASKYHKILQILHRLNHIHPALMPADVKAALNEYKRDINPFLNKPNPIPIDRFGRALGAGRRKASTARAWVVEGNGEVLVNGKSLVDAFAMVHDRESAIWALKATERIDKYNVWALVEGGGTTGQAEALTLAVAKALMAHEPSLKPALRRAGCITRDPRRVERKKPGKLKARKMPAWIKR